MSIADESAYHNALSAVRRYFDHEPKPDSDEARHFIALIDQIRAYETHRYAFQNYDGVTVLMNAMALTGRTQRDLGIVLGSLTQAQQILSNKRPLNMTQAQLLAKEWHISAKMLMKSG